MTRTRTLSIIGTGAALVLALSGCTTEAASTDAPTDEWSELAASETCSTLREENPDLVDTTMTNALNPHTPGYETVSTDDPNTYEGFDIDLGNAIGSCLGFSVDYVPVGFAEMIPTVASGQADWIVSNLYATEERAAGGVDFISYSKVFDGILVSAGNPKKITGIDTSLCGTTVALNKGYVEVPLVEAVAPDCEAEGLAAPTVSLFDSSADCVQAILSGRADSYMNDINTVVRYIDEHPDDLASAETVMLDYEIGIAVPQGEHKLRNAIAAAITEIQTRGIQQDLAERWKLEANEDAEPAILSVG
ncbi:MAG TPA: ABC transporter substrate-binding protein [Microbacterium sp.]|nr:ABC transporter substrate-binding protein [Microbacterium sp.]